MDDLYTTRQAGDMLGITDGRVRQLIAEYREQGHELGIKRGRDLFLTESDIEALRNRPRQWKHRRDRKRPQSED